MQQEKHNGLFGRIKYSEIRNIKVEGTLSNTKDQIGGIVGNSYTSKIDNCTNNCTINGSSYYSAGICGYATSSEIIKCKNLAEITGSHGVGGIVGIARYQSKILDSYNKGKIKTTTTGSQNGNYVAGGVVGYTDCEVNYTVNITNCYNIGDVYGYTNAGGIIGLYQAGGRHIINNCYSVGNLSGNAKYGILGQVSTWNGTPQLTINNTYWRSGCGASYGRYSASNAGAAPLSQEVLKTYATTLGDAFTDDVQNEDGTWKYNEGYPILKWEKEI